MNILIASCVFPPEPLVSAKTSFDLADFFAARGDNVTVVCSKPNRNISVNHPNYSNYNFKVVNLFTYGSKSAGLISRLFENLVFGISLFFFIIFSKKIDVVYGNVWPIFSTFFLSLACKIRGFKLLLSIQDLYPESLEMQGKISRSGLAYKLLLWVDKYSSRTANHLIVISESFKQAYVEQRFIAENKISVVKNWQKSENYITVDKELAKEKLSSLLGVDLTEHFIFVYGGNVGVASGVVDLVKCWIQSEVNSKLVIAGGGSMIKEVTGLADASKAKNVLVLSPWLPEHTSDVYSAADVLILPIASGQESSSIPSKLMGYMLSKRPILMKSASKSPASFDLDVAGGGLVVEDFDLITIKDAEHFFNKKSRSEIELLGNKNYEFAIQNYDATTALKKIEKIVLDVVGSTLC